MFWAYGNLRNLELICINSFLHHGFNLVVWTYGDITNLPKGAILKDARVILPETRVFKYKNGSYAGFSNLFRYAVISTIGGLYVDTDVICLIPHTNLQETPFLVTERVHGKSDLVVNSNIIFNPRPSRGDIIDLAFAFSDRYPVEKQDWGDCGPRLLTTIVSSYEKLSFEIKPPNFANPVDFWDCPARLLTPGASLPAESAFLHCYNEMWRRNRVSPDSKFPEGSIMANFSDRHL
jgi:hypothetical protein